jgi:hypothetical protein
MTITIPGVEASADTTQVSAMARAPKEPKPPITIVEACGEIFGEWFKDRRTWAAWFVFLKVIFGLGLDDTELAIFQKPMPKANEVNTTNRRAFLSTMVAVAGTAVVAGAAMALTPSADADPIFAAIENHQKLDKESLVLEAASDKAGLGDAISAAENAAWKMAQTKPTTVAGAAALLAYIATNPTNELFELGETDWHETAFRTVTAALAKITRQSHRAA